MNSEEAKIKAKQAIISTEGKILEKKIVQALRIRLKLIERTSQAIHDYIDYWRSSDRSKRERQISILMDTLKREEKVLAIVNEGISNTLSISKDVVSELNDAKIQKFIIEDIKILMNKLKKTHKRFSKIERRLELQRKFLSSGRGRDFEKFNRAFEGELKIDKKILKILNPAKIQPIMYALEKSLKPSDEVFGDIKSLMGGGAAVGAYTNIATHGSVHPSIIISALAGAIGGALAKISIELYEYEKEVYEIQKKAVKESKLKTT